MKLTKKSTSPSKPISTKKDEISKELKKKRVRK